MKMVVILNRTQLLPDIGWIWLLDRYCLHFGLKMQNKPVVAIAFVLHVVLFAKQLYEVCRSAFSLYGILIGIKIQVLGMESLDVIVI